MISKEEDRYIVWGIVGGLWGWFPLLLICWLLFRCLGCTKDLDTSSKSRPGNARAPVINPDLERLEHQRTPDERAALWEQDKRFARHEFERQKQRHVDWKYDRDNTARKYNQGSNSSRAGSAGYRGDVDDRDRAACARYGYQARRMERVLGMHKLVTGERLVVGRPPAPVVVGPFEERFPSGALGRWKTLPARIYTQDTYTALGPPGEWWGNQVSVSSEYGRAG